MRTIAIANQKGGVGKTTTAICLADALQREGKKVLLVDMDAQENSTATYRAVTEGENTIYDLLNKSCTAEEAIQHTEMGDIIPGDKLLSQFAFELQGTPGGFERLGKALKKVDALYDFCIIDTPPNLGIYMMGSLAAADEVLVPVKAEKYSMQGVADLLQTITTIKEDLNENLKILGVLLTNYDRRNRLDNDLWTALKEQGDELAVKVMPFPIHVSQDVKKAQEADESLLENFPTCNAAADYVELAQLIIQGV